MKVTLQKWQLLSGEELKRVDKVMLGMTEDKADLIPQLVSHIIKSGGKRLRPILTILSAKLCGYKGERHINLAAAIEFLHTATLLHDDVVDESKLRRGISTANNVWGNAASVLVGDFLLSRAFQLMASDGSIEVLQILSDTSAVITEGEVKQLMAVNDITTDKKTYIDIVASKTAQLFAAACQIGAVITEKPEREKKALFDFGCNLGVAFQIVDDALDYSAKQEELGKTIGDDFREGKVTLPVIFAYEKGDKEERRFWRDSIEGNRGKTSLNKAIKLINKHKVLEQTISEAKNYTKKASSALEMFGGSDEKNTMLELLEFSVSRPY